jgi:glycosyltransferase involved in cell wall biosynthesis
MSATTYGVVTPARNEAPNLRRLAACLAEQTLLPELWVIVDDGSSDTTASVAAELAAEWPWIDVVRLVSSGPTERGGPVVRAFEAGVERLDPLPDVVVKLDADLTLDPTYFERLVAAFADDARLGIASGICLEERDGAWRPLHGTRSHVWGAARAYRRGCLTDVRPLVERQGWDEIDALRAQVRGWRVGTIPELSFRHHRPEGERDGGSRRWADQGDTAHYMGYRFSYLLLRTLFNLRDDRAAIAMPWGFLRATLERRSTLDDPDVRALLRREQRVRALPVRLREALGRS